LRRKNFARRYREGRKSSQPFFHWWDGLKKYESRNHPHDQKLVNSNANSRNLRKTIARAPSQPIRFIFPIFIQIVRFWGFRAARSDAPPFRVKRDLTGNLPGLPAVFPDTLAPVVRTARDGERELTMMRWGFPPPPNLGNAPVTNVRNLKSPDWLKAEWRCLVPATSFCEWTDTRPKVTHWFAVDESRPIFAFAGIWRLCERIQASIAVPRVQSLKSQNRASWLSAESLIRYTSRAIAIVARP
jgi:hypothetical protein